MLLWFVNLHSSPSDLKTKNKLGLCKNILIRTLTYLIGRVETSV